jgi:serine/threonine protein phosphatase PrpC
MEGMLLEVIFSKSRDWFQETGVSGVSTTNNSHVYANVAVLDKLVVPEDLMWGKIRRSIPTACGSVLTGILGWNSSCEAQITTHVSSTSYSHSFPANNPSEDRLLILNSQSQQPYQVFGVFDGHGGWQVSDYMKTKTPTILVSKLESGISVESAINETFHEIEKNYSESIRPAYQLGFGDVAKVGCCANISILHDAILTVANSGDCRTIIATSLGPASEHVSYDNNPVIANVQGELYTSYHVGRDHNARTALEQFLLSDSHPNEENIVRCKNDHACYVKGRLQLTRALGDLYLKSHEFNAPSDSLRSR